MIHYFRPDGQYGIEPCTYGTCWGVHVWGEAIAEETRWTRPIFWKGRDDFGVYYVIQATGNKDILKNAWVSYIIHRGQRKDQGGADMAWEAGKYREIFVINSDCMIYTKLAEAMVSRNRLRNDCKETVKY